MTQFDGKEMLELFRVWKHDGFTPLTAIKGYARLLLTPGAMPAEITPMQKQMIEVIYRNSVRAASGWDDALRGLMFRYGEPRIEWQATPVADIVEKALNDLKGYELPEVKTELAPDLPMVKGCDWLSFVISCVLFAGPAFNVDDQKPSRVCAETNADRSEVILHVTTGLLLKPEEREQPALVYVHSPASRLTTGSLMYYTLYGRDLIIRPSTTGTEYAFSVPACKPEEPSPA